MKKYLNLNTVYFVFTVIVLAILIVPPTIEFIKLQIQGISYVANEGENYYNKSFPIEGEFTIEIDLSKLEGNEGKVLFDDEENRIYVSEIISHNETGFEVIFRSSGSYSSGGATLVSGIDHVQDPSSFQAEAEATYKGDTYKLSPSGSSGLNYRDGDEFGFYVELPEALNMEADSMIKVTVTNLYVNIWAEKL